MPRHGVETDFENLGAVEFGVMVFDWSLLNSHEPPFNS